MKHFEVSSISKEENKTKVGELQEMEPDKKAVIKEILYIHRNLFRKDDAKYTLEEEALLKRTSEFQKVIFCNSNPEKFYRCVLCYIIGNKERRGCTHEILTINDLNEIRFNEHSTYNSFSALKNKKVIVNFGAADLLTKDTEAVLKTVTQNNYIENEPIIFWFTGTRKKLEEKYGCFLDYIKTIGYKICDLNNAKEWCQKHQVKT